MKFDDQLLIFKTEKKEKEKESDVFNYEEKLFSSILKINTQYTPSKEEDEEKKKDLLFTNPPLIKYSSFDDNNDGLMDRFNFRISFVTDNNTTAINNLRLIFLFSYEFKINIVGKMNTAAFIDIDTPLGASYIKVTGSLNLRQKSPIDRTTFYNEYYYENVFENSYYGEKINFYEIENEYYSRNFSTSYDYDTFIQPVRNSRIVKMDIDIYVPSFQKILYRTPLSTKIKFFWVQYCAVFIPIGCIIYFIMQFVFRNHIVSTINSNDIDFKKEKVL